jgi:hypothetical protein
MMLKPNGALPEKRDSYIEIDKFLFGGGRLFTNMNIRSLSNADSLCDAVNGEHLSHYEQLNTLPLETYRENQKVLKEKTK